LFAADQRYLEVKTLKAEKEEKLENEEKLEEEKEKVKGVKERWLLAVDQCGAEEV